MTRIRGSIAACLFLVFVGPACDSSTAPTTPVAASGVTFGLLSPPGGSTITVSTGTPPGAFIPRGSGQLSVSMTIRSDRDVPWAQLNLYLLTDDGSYCGQNLPDAPTWEPFRARQNLLVSVTGFQIYRLPCDVTGVRAMLHTRNSLDLTPPTAGETVVEGTAAVRYALRQ